MRKRLPVLYAVVSAMLALDRAQGEEHGGVPYMGTRANERLARPPV